MGQTLGGQIFGVWYDIAGWLIFSGLFFYFAIASPSWPLATRNKLPAFLLNKKICIGLGIVCAISAIGKLLAFW